MLIYHIVRTDVWSNFRGTHYEAESFSAEGFIHCSFADQLDAVLKRYYSRDDEVIVLEINPEKLDSRLVVEPSTGGEKYPHIYGTINRDAIVGEQRRKIT
jgi:uncharacterized protein (DUF952 family)